MKRSIEFDTSPATREDDIRALAEVIAKQEIDILGGVVDATPLALARYAFAEAERIVDELLAAMPAGAIAIRGVYEFREHN